MTAKVAYLYYIKKMRQQEIADSLQISRFKVLRLLKHAEESGIVEVKIKEPLGSCTELELQIKQAFGIRDVIVVPAEIGPIEVVGKALGPAAGTYLSDLITDGMTVCVSWGRTLHHAVTNMSPAHHSNTSVVQFMGGLARISQGIDAQVVAHRLAELFGAKCHLLHAPAVTKSPTLKSQLLREPSIQRTLDLASRSDIALFGLGVPDDASPLVYAGYISAEDVRSFASVGAVGTIGARLYDARGKEVGNGYLERVIGLSLEQLRAIPLKVAVAGGLHKAAAIAGALSGGLVDVLITDEETAAMVCAIRRETH